MSRTCPAEVRVGEGIEAMQRVQVDEELQRAPRLHLDYSDLAYIADGDADAAEVAALHAAMRAAGAVLVLSLAHPLDYWAKVRDQTREAVADAINAFPRVAVVVRGPMRHAGEDVELADVELMALSDVRQLGDDGGDAVIRLATDAMAVVREVDAAVAEANLGSPAMPQRLLDEGKALMMGVLAGERQREELYDWARRQSGGAGLTPEQEEQMRRLLDERLDQARATPLADQFITAARRPPPDLANTAPGAYLHDTLRRIRGAHGSKPKPGDLMDALHARLFPYVDVATADKATCNTLSGVIGKVSRVRPVRLIRSKRLGLVVSAVASLGGTPTAGG